MMVTMSNPGLNLAIIGNPGPRHSRRRVKTRRHSSTKGKKMAFTKKQARALAKAFRAQGRAVPAKIRRKMANPGTATGARKARRIRARKVMGRRRAAAKTFRAKLRGYKVVVRRKAGKRKANTKWGRKHNIRTGRKGSISFRKPVGRGKFKRVATNPRRKARRSRRTRRNPAISAKSYVGSIRNLPKNVQSLLKGKDMLPNALYAAGGMLGGMVVGGMVRGTIMSALPASMATNRMIQGTLGALITYTGGYAVGQLAIKNDRKRTAFLTGAAAAAVINLIAPGAISGMLTRLPIIGPRLALMPGMNGYVSAPSYQGVGAYVSAPSYQGVGSYDNAVAGIGYSDDALAGELGAYVSAPSYQGVGDVGMYGSSHLD